MVSPSLPIPRLIAACVVLGVAALLASPAAFGARGDITTLPTGQFYDPVDVVEAADGSILVAHRVGVQRIAPDGTVSNAAGSTSADWNAPLGDGGPATAARLEPSALAALPDGGFLVGDHGSDRVRRVFPDGRIDTVAGGGHNGDGCLATRAQLDDPEAISLTGDGGYLISDWANGRIVRVWPDGSLTTVAGDTSSAASGDGTIATETHLSGPSDVSADADGSFLIAQPAWDRVHRVSADGRIQIVAGGRGYGFTGDGGPATSAQLNHPIGVAAVAGGGFLIADQYNHRIRRVTPGGSIDTIAGSGLDGSANGSFGGDGGPATAARMNLPADVTLRRGGGVLIADWWNHRIRALDSPLQPAAPAPASGFRGTGGYSGACLGLDPSFSGGSINVPNDAASSVVLQVDGKIVTGGAGTANGRRVTLRRFLADGRPDNAFGEGGTVGVSVQSGGRPLGLGYVTAMTEQPGTGGKLLVAGVWYEPQRELAAVARFNSDGQLDRSFGTDGRTLVEGDLTSVAVAPNGQIVAAGSFSGASTAHIQKSLVARLSPDGQLDSSFGGDGTVVGPFTGQFSGVAGRADGRVVVSGEVGTGRPGLALQAARYTASGEIDPTFGDGGTAVAYPSGPPSEAESHALAVQPDGKILVAGWGVARSGDIGRRMMVARFAPDGRPDASFAGDGIALVAPRGVDGIIRSASAYALALQPDGKIVLGGTGSSGTVSGSGFAVMRLTREGSLDRAFGPGGGYFTPVGAGGAVQGLAVQPDGKVVAAGGSTAGLGIARYGSVLPPGSPPDQGSVTTPAGNRPGTPVSAAAGDRSEATTAHSPAARRETRARITVTGLRSATVRRLTRRGLAVRVRVSRPGTLSLRITAARKGGRPVLLAIGSRRMSAGTSRVVLVPPQAIRSKLARMSARRLRTTLRAELVEAGGGRTSIERRVTLRRR